MQKATEDEKLVMFQSYDAFIFDLDGTLWLGSKLVPGALELIELLRYHNKKVYFVTNNATKSRQGYVKKLASLGIPCKLEEVYSSSFAAAAYLKNLGFNQKAYVIGEAGLVEELSSAGIEALGGPQHNDAKVDWSTDPHMTIDPEVGAVVVGLDRDVNYYKLQYGTLCLIQNEGCSFIATNTDARGNFNQTQEWAGAGTMVAALIGSSEREPVLVGKPASFILDHICSTANLNKEQCMVVGDRLDTDILWGNQNGAGTCCVLTGVTSEKLLLSEENKIRPTYYMDSVADFLSIKSKITSSCSIQ